MRRPHRRLYRSAVVLAVALLVGGALLAYRGYTRSDGPDGAVRGYFAALARGDASAALSYGAVPAGPHQMLTDTVLGEQRRIGALKQVRLGAVRRTGSAATVPVHYMLDYAGDPQSVDTTVQLHQSDGRWRLDRVAVATQLMLPKAGQRATILGTAIPEGSVLFFPGPAPVRLDTPYLQVAPSSSSIDFGSGATTLLGVSVSDEGRRQAQTAVGANLLACVSGRGPRTCPLPDDRVVPGSLRGSLTAATPDLTVTVADSDAGVLDVSGSVGVVGTYRRLTFSNVTVAAKGRVRLPVQAAAYAVTPLRFVWTNS
jgi:hypothetical protein